MLTSNISLLLHFYPNALDWGNFINTMLYKPPGDVGFGLGTKMVVLRKTKSLNHEQSGNR
jgi:hypothetical protein